MKKILALLLLATSALADEHKNTPVIFDTGSSLTINTGVVVNGLIQPSGTPTAGTVAVFNDAKSIRNAGANEVFDFNPDNGDTFLPAWDARTDPHVWAKFLFGSAFTISASSQVNNISTSTLNVKFDGLDMTAADYNDLPGLTDVLAAKPTIVATRFATGQTGSNSGVIAYSVPNDADHTYEVSMEMKVTAVTTISTTMDCRYTDETNTTRNVIFPVTKTDGNWVSGGAIAANGTYTTATLHVRCKAGTTLSLTVEGGTFTGVTYNISACAKRVL